MMIKLTREERILHDDIDTLEAQIRSRDRAETEEEEKVYLADREQVANKACQLHNSLAARGLEPRYSRHLLKKRQVSPSSAEFYSDPEAVEALLMFLFHPERSGDPPDRTIGQHFTFSVRHKSWSNDHVYEIIRTEHGWSISHWDIGGPCDIEGEPYLFRNLERDRISYPCSLPYYFKLLWIQARDKGLTSEEVQEALNVLANWVRQTEQRSPNEGVFSYAQFGM